MKIDELIHILHLRIDDLSHQWIMSISPNDNNKKEYFEYFLSKLDAEIASIVMRTVNIAIANNINTSLITTLVKELKLKCIVDVADGIGYKWR